LSQLVAGVGRVDVLKYLESQGIGITGLR
jgi:hypothetical protein